MNEPPESSTSTDEPADASEPVHIPPETPSEHVGTLETEPESTSPQADPNPTDASTTPPPSTGPSQRPPRTQQILTIAALVFIVLAVVIFAIEVATQ
jgi:hypothetical protein